MVGRLVSSLGPGLFSDAMLVLGSVQVVEVVLAAEFWDLLTDSQKFPSEAPLRHLQRRRSHLPRRVFKTSALTNGARGTECFPHIALKVRWRIAGFKIR